MQAVYENHYLTDTDVANYARQSFAKLSENFTADQNANLIKFLARGAEVNWVWPGSLYAFTNVYNQRSDNHAQKEVQDLAHQIDSIISSLYPISWQALTHGVY